MRRKFEKALEIDKLQWRTMDWSIICDYYSMIVRRQDKQSQESGLGMDSGGSSESDTELPPVPEK